MRRLLLVLLAALPLVAACGGDDDGSAGGTLTVLAASSLTEALGDVADAFEDANDGVDVELSFGASSALVQQANAGAPADVIVTADASTYGALTDAGEPTVIARNHLALLVGRGNPEGITSLADLARDDVVLVLCAPEVPCGKLGAEALADAGVDVTPASLEENVKGVVSKVALGEADAGLAYVTDATDDVDAVAIDGAPETSYPMGVLGQASDDARAQAFVDFVASGDGQAILADHGFLAP